MTGPDGYVLDGNGVPGSGARGKGDAGMDEHEHAEQINPPNALRTKVTIGGPGAVDSAMLERAESAIANLSGNYLEWVKQDLAKLETAFAKLKDGQGGTNEILREIFGIVHDMRGQGGSFGYHLITVIGNQLCRFIDKVTGPGPDETEAIRLHIEAMQLVIAEDMRGDGGPQARQLLDGLERVAARLCRD